MKKTVRKKLALSKETVSSLETGELIAVVGAAPSGNFSCGFTWCNACPNTR